VIAAVAPDVVFLAAADAWVERCEREPENTRQVNVEAARTVATAAASLGAQIVVFSSEYVFDGTSGRYSEGDPRDPINEYGRQKVELEDIALGTPRGLVCRTSAVFGVDEGRKNFVYQLIAASREGRTLDVPSDQLITPTFARALADAVVALVDRGASGVFHVAGPEIMGRVAFAQLVARVFQLEQESIRPRPTNELGLLAPRPRQCGLGTEKLVRALGAGLTSATEGLHAMRDALGIDAR
jgi:dTDP-4-dehydrorhamnose reductase